MARFIADQRTNYAVPHTLVCALLGVSLAWFYKWIKRANGPGAASGLFTDTDRRRDSVDRAVKVAFKDAKGLHGSPRLHADLRDAGWEISEKTVAESMRRQGLVARVIKRRGGLTRQDKTKKPFPDLLCRDFTAPAPNCRWVGDITEIPTAEGKLYLATVIDLYSRRLLGAATSAHPDAELACAAIRMAVTARGGKEAIWREDQAERLVFHTDRGSTYSATSFTTLCADLGIRQSMGRVGSCLLTGQSPRQGRPGGGRPRSGGVRFGRCGGVGMRHGHRRRCCQSSPGRAALGAVLSHPARARRRPQRLPGVPG
ncbi:IS3 family transposase [Ornithinimicrobium sp. W1665]|uniref:IS3 family transposase n=1 Tax=Ornithinimicrobium sp. W1665 TaxID=3416666 RepID=UPI003CF60A26